MKVWNLLGLIGIQSLGNAYGIFLKRIKIEIDVLKGYEWIWGAFWWNEKMEKKQFLLYNGLDKNFSENQ